MKKNSIVFLVSALLFVLIASLQSKAQFMVQGEYRARTEYRDGYKKPPSADSNAAFFVNQRVRLSFLYNTKNISSKVTLQEARVWGNEKLKNTAASLFFYEAWIDWKLCDSMSLKIGRQELLYDNERILSNNNWSLAGQTHDAAVLKLKLSGLRIDLGMAFNQTQENVYNTDYSNGPSGNYKTLNYLWIGKELKSFKFSVVGIADGFQKAGTTNTTYLRGTYGSNLAIILGNTQILLRGYYQNGKTPTGQTISAYYLCPELNTLLFNKLTLNPGMEYISGNDATHTTNVNYNAFSTLYGTGHTFLGHMDYFIDIPKDTKKAGLVDVYLKTTLKTSDKVALKADYHFFSLQNNYVVNHKTIAKNLGQEVDLNCKVDFTKDLSLQFGYSFMIPYKSMEIIVGGEEHKYSQWAWAMITFKPTLFNSAK